MFIKKIQEISALIGFAVLLIGSVAYFRDILTNPIYFLIVFFGGYCPVFFYCINKIKKKESQTSTIMSHTADKYSNINYVLSRKTRIFAIVILSATTLALLTLGFTVITKKNPVAQPPILVNGKALFDFVEINKVSWTGGGAYAVVGKNEYPLAHIIDTAHIERMTRLMGTACALKFEIETRSDLDRVSIDDFKVLVFNYQPLPKYESMIPAPFQDENVLYVEIDNPAICKTESFSAIKRITKEKKVEDFGIIYLEKGKPETFVIRINAKTPGIYKIECQMEVRYKKKIKSVRLNKPIEWLFDW